jgi:oligopeptide transport system substrate-binding protein
MTQVAEFEVGNLDNVQIPMSELDRWTADPRWAGLVEREVQLAVVYIGLNNQKPPFDDPRVRRALNYAVDTRALAERLMRGMAVRARGAIPPGLPGYDPNREAWSYDVSLARDLLKEAGHPDGFPMEIWYREGGGAEQVLEAIQAYLKDAGVEASLVAREWGTLKEAINQGVPDAYYLDWYADYPDAENFLFPLFHSDNWGGGGNRARYSNPVVDSLIVEARRKVDPEERNALYARIDGMVYNDAPWIYLWHPVRLELRQPWVRGTVLHPLFYGQRYMTVTKTRRAGRDAG